MANQKKLREEALATIVRVTTQNKNGQYEEQSVIGQDHTLQACLALEAVDELQRKWPRLCISSRTGSFRPLELFMEIVNNTNPPVAMLPKDTTVFPGLPSRGNVRITQFSNAGFSNLYASIDSSDLPTIHAAAQRLLDKERAKGSGSTPGTDGVNEVTRKEWAPAQDYNPAAAR